MKNGKKIILTLAATLLLSTSVGHAQGIRYTIKTKFNNSDNTKYNVEYNNDSNKYLQKRFGNLIIKFKPIFDWDFEDKKDNEQENNNEKPEIPEKPQEPTPEKPVEPEKPEEKPEEPKKPEKPQEPEKPIEKPEEPQKPEPKPEEPKQEEPNQNLSVEREVARLVNIERQKVGLAPLTFSEEISRVAEAKSQDMANKNYFSHTSPTYGDPFEMMRSFGIKFGYAGENIAKGYRSAQSVMNGWMNSSGHRANILNSNFKKIGVGYVEANGTTYWTQMFTD